METKKTVSAGRDGDALETFLGGMETTDTGPQIAGRKHLETFLGGMETVLPKAI